MASKKITLITIAVVAAVLAGVFYISEQFSKRNESPQDNSNGPGALSTIQKAYADKLTACKSLPNNSTQEVAGASRVFINLPKDIYPNKDHNLQFHSIDPTATAGAVTNAGAYGEAQNAPEGCWSYYYEFNGGGIIDLSTKSAQSPMPDYHVRFIVQSGS